MKDKYCLFTLIGQYRHQVKFRRQVMFLFPTIGKLQALVLIEKKYCITSLLVFANDVL